MAGLLDMVNSPAGVGLLSALAGGMAGARRNTPWNNVGRGMVTGLGGYQGAQQQIRADEENAFAKQYKQMQMQQIEQTLARQKGEQDWKANLPNIMNKTVDVTAPFQADDPFGEGIGAGLSNIVGQAPDMQARQDYMMQPDSPLAEEMLKRQYLPKDEARTAEQKNFEYAQNLPEDQREMFMSRAGGGSAPATVQEWEYFSKLPPAAQSQFLEMKRNPQIMNLGGTQAVRAPGGGIGESYAVTPKPTDMPEFQAAQETAKTTARGSAERESKAISELPKIQASAKTARSMVQGVLDHPGFSSTVGMTMLPGARFIPGTKQADFMSRMDQLKGSAFLQAFETLKGGGQITEVEGDKATSAINRMSIATSEKEFRAAAKDFLDVVDMVEQNAIRGAKSEPTQDEAGYIQQRRAAGVPDAEIAKELNAKTASQAKPAATFDLPPNAKQYEGKTLRDTKSGKRFKSVNGKWQEVK